MSDRLVTNSPYGSPDTLRAFLQISKRFYNLHTPRQMGYTDVDDLQYVGTAENFGSEIFFESKKLRLFKPTNKFVKMSTTLTSNFNIEPSDYMDSYLQYGMRMCTMKPNVFNPLQEVKIRFSDVTKIVVPRSDKDGEYSVHRTIFYMTTTPPVLEYYDRSNHTLLRTETLSVGLDGSAKYFLPKNKITDSLITLNSETEILTEDILGYPEIPFLYFTSNEFITIYPVEMDNNVDRNGYPLLTIGTNGQGSTFIYAGGYGRWNIPEVADPEKDDHIGPHSPHTSSRWYIRAYGDFIPCDKTKEPSWVSLEMKVNDDIILQESADVSILGDQFTQSMLNSIWHIKSIIPNEDPNLSEVIIEPKTVSGSERHITQNQLTKCFKKYFDGNVYTVYEGRTQSNMFIPREFEYNLGVQIKRVDFVLLDGTTGTLDLVSWDRVTPIVVHTITFDTNDRYSHVRLAGGNIVTYMDVQRLLLRQHFTEIKEGDYAYDPTRIDQGVAYYVNIEQCNAGGSDPFDPSQISFIANPFFRIMFSDEFYFNRENDLNHFVSGVHLDYTSDYSDNSVPKKFGTIHNLGDFDGLPDYFKSYNDRTIHRAHVEMYAIRDDANRRNQKTTDKQTAAIILDSAIPQNEIKDMSDISIVIKYERDNQGGGLQPKYVTDESAIISTTNYTSDIRFISNDRFVDNNVNNFFDRNDYPRFIYHGNGYFSLGYIDYDPELETARGYLITNDGVAYINNVTSKNPKAERTVARICDIPTSFTQLLSIKGKSPTLIIDEKYVRTPASIMLRRPILVDSEADVPIIYTNDIDRLWNYNISKRFMPNTGYSPYVANLLVDYDGTSNPALIKHPYCELTFVLPMSGQFYWKMTENQTFVVHGSLITKNANGDSQIPTGSEAVYWLDNGGEHYAVDDIVGFNIGGVFLKVRILAVNGGSVTDYEFHLNDSYPGMIEDGDVLPDIPISNFDDMPTYYHPTTLSGIGTGMVIGFAVANSVLEEYKPPTYDWQYGRQSFSPESQPPYADTMRDDIYAFTCDSRNHIVYITELKQNYSESPDDVWDIDHRIQLTGYMGYTNSIYDDPQTLYARNTKACLIYHMLSAYKYINKDLLDYTNNPQNYVEVKSQQIPYDQVAGFTFESLDAGSDFSSLISKIGWNQYSSFFTIVKKSNGYSVDSANAYVLSYKFALDLATVGNFTSYNGLNVNSFNRYTGSLLFSRQEPYPYLFDIHARSNNLYTRYAAFMKRTLRPDLKLTDMIPISDGYPADAYPLYESNQMRFPMYRITQNPTVFDPNVVYPITDVEQISGIDTDDVTEYEYHTTTWYPAGTFLYVEGNDTLYRARVDFAATNLRDDLANNKLMIYGERGSSSGHHYEALDSLTEYGGFVPITDVYDATVTVESETYDNNPLYIFRIDRDIDSNQLNSFRMYDNDMDISAACMLIINGKPYVFRNNGWELHYHI